MITTIGHHYDEREFELCCDDCGEIEFITGDFRDVTEYIEDNGWKTVKDSDGYSHYCHICADKN
jgi:hypothetical protein